MPSSSLTPPASEYATSVLLQSLPLEDPYVMSDALQNFAYNDVLHAYYASLPFDLFFLLGVINIRCCKHLNIFASKIYKVHGVADLLASLPWELLFPILRDMAFRDRVRLSQTSKRNYALCSAILHFTLGDTLTRFNLDYPGFRLMQTVTGAHLSGSIAPSLMHNGDLFRPEDIDIYAPVNEGWRVAQYVCNSGGYTIDPTLPTYASLPGVGRLWSLRSGKSKIHIIESHTASARDSALHHHSSPVMATICAIKGWLAYPVLSTAGLALATRHSLIVPPVPDGPSRVQDIVHKYMRRGFTYVFEYPHPHVCGEHLSCPTTVRNSVDRGCLNLFLPPSPFGAVAPGHESSWTLRGNGCRQGGVAYAATPAILPASNYEDTRWVRLLEDCANSFGLMGTENV
ncbi:hypothetical protein DFH09DRAFT_1300998 [Mycena vulgaris]|nr:hypothetical protein DFH09DRAFT_1340957 [Mycena vulgaris]KAJ6604850.1 hypothetical protein DFH09DRAFT_1300998 [Mycena vulgaris]